MNVVALFPEAQALEPQEAWLLVMVLTFTENGDEIAYPLDTVEEMEEIAASVDIPSEIIDEVATAQSLARKGLGSVSLHDYSSSGLSFTLNPSGRTRALKEIEKGA